MAKKIYRAKTYFLQNNNANLLVATEKTGHAANTEKPVHMFTFCEENGEKCRNIKVSNISSCVSITKTNQYCNQK